MDKAFRMMMLSVIVATLMRPSLQDLLTSLKEQTLQRDKWELLTMGPQGEMNEYESRNWAAKRAKGDVFVFLDDDTHVPRNYLERGLQYFQDPRVMMLDGCIEGDFFGWGGTVRIDKKYWGIGATLWIRKSAFEAVGGFKVDWDLGKKLKGWRGDSSILYDVLEKFGEEAYVHASDMTVYHPKAGGSVWQPEIEAEFYKRYKAYVLTYIAPYDPRICSFVLANGLETDPLVLKYLANDQKVRADWARINAVNAILDLGSGDGWTFHGTRFEHTNMDIDRYDIENFIQGDACKLPFEDGWFNTVVAGEILEHVDEPSLLIKEALRVAKKLVLITTPDEYSWGREKAPLLTREERMKRDGFSNIDDMQENFTGKNAYCSQMVKESERKHTWHQHWFTAECLKSILEPFGVKYTMERLTQDGFTWFAVRMQKPDSP